MSVWSPTVHVDETPKRWSMTSPPTGYIDIGDWKEASISKVRKAGRDLTAPLVSMVMSLATVSGPAVPRPNPYETSGPSAAVEDAGASVERRKAATQARRGESERMHAFVPAHRVCGNGHFFIDRVGRSRAVDTRGQGLGPTEEVR